MEPREAIKKHIQENGLKQNWVAERAGMPAIELSEYITGRRKLTVQAYIRICDALGVSLDTFRGEGGAA